MAPDAVAFLGLAMEGAKTTNFAGLYFPVMENVIADAPQTIPKTRAPQRTAAKSLTNVLAHTLPL